jgi:hypothetical protein
VRPDTALARPAAAELQLGRGDWLVDVELVAFRVLHPDRIVVEVLVARHANARGSEPDEALDLGIDALAPRFDGERAAAADGDVQVQPVLGSLEFGYDLEPDARTGAIRIDDAVLTDPQVIFAQAKVAPVVVPGCETLLRWLELVSQGGGPEAGEWFRIPAVNNELEGDGHQAFLTARSESLTLCSRYPTLARDRLQGQRELTTSGRHRSRAPLSSTSWRGSRRSTSRRNGDLYPADRAARAASAWAMNRSALRWARASAPGSRPYDIACLLGAPSSPRRPRCT